MKEKKSNKEIKINLQDKWLIRLNLRKKSTYLSRQLQQNINERPNSRSKIMFI